MSVPTYFRLPIVAIFASALIAAQVGCRGKARNELYRQKMANEIRVLEDQLYDADYKNRVLRDRLEKSSTATSSPSVETSLPATTSTVSPTTALSALSVCESYSEPMALGSITDPDLIEVSGIAIGSEGVVWAHNDSGSVPQLWALDVSGAVLQTVAISARNIDWEDISIGPGPDGARTGSPPSLAGGSLRAPAGACGLARCARLLALANTRTGSLV